jgi:hypothetical protein
MTPEQIGDVESQRRLAIRESEVSQLHRRIEELNLQLRVAQEVINTHVADQIKGLHCVDCDAEEDEVCDCPMLVPIFEAMKGYTEKQNREPECTCSIDGTPYCKAKGTGYCKASTR